MASTIKIKNSSTASAVPTSSDLVQGELAVNVTDKRVFTENASGTVVELGINPSSLTLANGTANGVAYLNGSKVLTTGSALVFDGTNLGIGASSPTNSANVKTLDIRGTNGGQFLLGRTATPSDLFMYSTSTGSTIGTNASMFLRFMTNSDGTTNERMRIDSSGNLLVGTTSTVNASKQVILFPGNTQNGSSIQTSQNTSGAVFQYFLDNAGATCGSITRVGTTSAVLYNTSSDRRLKENISDADSASSLIESLQVRKFDWKADGSHQRYGFVAQELVTVAPEAVHQPKDTDEMMAVDYSKLVPMLVKEIQSLRQRVASLEA